MEQYVTAIEYFYEIQTHALGYGEMEKRIRGNTQTVLWQYY